MMRITRSLICLFLMLPASAVWAQTSNGTPKLPGILGYLDPQSGAFRLVPQVAEGPSAALTTVQGRIAVSLTITVKSAKITGVSCSVTVTTVDGDRVYEESAKVDAAATDTNQRTCKVNIPYSWDLASPSSANVITSYFVHATGSGASEGPLDRSTKLSPLSTQKVPPNGGEIFVVADVTI